VLLRILALSLTLFAALTLSNPDNGSLHALIWPLKLLSSALAPALALTNFLLGLLGLRRKDVALAAAGATGMLLAASHTWQASASRDAAFEQTFGPKWETMIPSAIGARLSSTRWRPVDFSPPRGPVHRNIVYAVSERSGQPLLADIMEPPPDAVRSGLALLYVHGGGWRFGKRNIDKFPYFRRLAWQGHVIMDIDYTATADASVQDMAQDVKRALLWLKENAATYGINPDCIVLGGQSAGAHLALLSAYANDEPQLWPSGWNGDASVLGVISYYGPTDLALLYNDVLFRFGDVIQSRASERVEQALVRMNNPGSSLARGIEGLMGGKPEDIPETYELLSPITYASPKSPPTLLFHGQHDFLVAPQHSRLLYEKLRAAGAPVIYIAFRGDDHSFESTLPRVSPSAQTAAYYTERFMGVLAGMSPERRCR